MSNRYQTRQAGDEFLEKVRVLVEYWDGQLDSNVPETRTTRERLEGLAHSILTAIDQGNLALVPVALLEAEGRQESDVSGELNDFLFNRGRWGTG